MNKSAFLELIKQSAAISVQQTAELEQVAAAFPYCQTAHLLLAKSAHDNGSMLSTQRLRKASAYATNRQVLKRVIYTSPAPAPIFETATSIEEATYQETAETISPSLAQPTEALNPDPEVPAVPEITVAETAPTETDVQEELPIITEVEPQHTEYAAPTIYTYEPEQPVAADEASEDSVISEVESIAPEEEDAQQELAHLFTISSLSSSFTDLLAQKADEEETEVPTTLEFSQAVSAAIPAFDEEPEADDALEQIIKSESERVFAQQAYVLEDNLPAPAEEIPTEEKAATPNTAPAPATIHYAQSELDRMYTEDALGYWMASSRMGETLQLKDELTRQQPAAFHPELILEYAKTHELAQEPQQPPVPAHYQQLNIIDQFLRLNPRLKTMNNIKVKQEPQEDLSLRNSKIKKGIASESLANIFIKQGKHRKAIKIYEQLILKYPEKKSYFAEQIEKLQNLS